MHPVFRVVQPSRSIPHASYGTVRSIPRVDETGTAPQTVSALSKERHQRSIDWKSPETRAALDELKFKWQYELKRNCQKSRSDYWRSLSR